MNTSQTSQEHASSFHELPKILVFGERGSGKTSIIDVIFEKTAPHDTLPDRYPKHLLITNVEHNPYVKYSVWDLPGGYKLDEKVDAHGEELTPHEVLANTAAVVIVLEPDNGEDDDRKFTLLRDVSDNIRELCDEGIPLFVFVHKIDGELFESEENKMTHLQSFQETIDSGFVHEDVIMEFYLTSIFDSSIYEAFSKVVQKLIPQRVGIEGLLNVLIHTCLMDKVLLVDVVSKLFLATDHNPMDLVHYNLCSDLLDVVLDVSCLYGWDKASRQAFDTESAAVIKLNNSLVLYLRYVSQNIAIVCFIPQSCFLREQLIEFNVRKFSEALEEVFSRSLYAPIADSAPKHQPSDALPVAQVVKEESAREDYAN